DFSQEYNEKIMTLLTNTYEQVSIINSKIKRKSGYQAKQILMDELQSTGDTNETRGTSIIKKIYKGIDVACKKITIEKEKVAEVEKLESQLAILEKLHHCDYIHRFYGILNAGEDEKIMVYGWAEHGNLKEVYEKYSIPWGKKLSIALGICRGLVFLNATKIYHHDIRCENILMNSRWEPKIANFKIARWISGETKKYTDPVASLNWMAPEKMKEFEDPNYNANPKKYRYTTSCEIFSFGMLLWELKYERKPYENMTVQDLVKHVISGKREKLNCNKLLPHGVEGKYIEIIRLAWEHEPLFRIEMATLFKKMLDINREYREISKFDINIIPKEKTPSSKNIVEGIEQNVNDDIHAYIKVIPPIEDGIKAYESERYDEAWKIFKENSELGISTANYWVGRFYWEGLHIKKDKEKALEYYEKAASDANSEAQYTYAVSLIDIYKDKSFQKKAEIIKNLKMAAANGHSKALNLLGHIYLNGKLQSTIDKKLAIEYYKLAALKGQTDAIKTLNEMGIDMYE
ncbi:13811_t:CDS:2, partial [Acaulospora morrowiae]